MKKYFWVSFIFLLCLVTALPLQVMAVNDDLVASISGSGSGDTSASDGTLSMTVTGSNVNGTLTLKNNGTSTAMLSFSYVASGDISSITIAGASVSNSGSYSAELVGGASVAVYLSVPRKSLFGSDKSATVALSNVKLETPRDANVTISYNEAGSVSAGTTSVTSGDSIEVPATGTTLTATPKDGAAFVGWINAADNSVVSNSASFTYKPTGDVALKAVFASSSVEASFWGSNKAYLFEGLSAAITHASNASNKVIILAGNGKLSSGNYTIPANVTLLIPFDSAGTVYTDTPGCDKDNWTSPTPYYTLTMKNGANITVAEKGAISVSAMVTGKMAFAGNPTTKYGHVAMEEGSTITVNSGANLYAWGYITGSGHVTIKSGGTVYESFQVTDWRGGTYTTKMLDNSSKVFPMTQYYVQNVEVPMTLESGAVEKCSLAAVISSMLQQKIVPFIGQTGHMFNIDSGSITKRYDGSKDRLILDIDGSFSVGTISLVMSEGILGFGKVEINSANYVLPVNNNITLNINSGSTMNIGSAVSFLPGVQVNIAERGTLKVASGQQLFVYDATEWTGKGFIYNQPSGLVDFASVVYAHSKNYTRTVDKDIVDAKIVVNGTLDASEGYLYTTSSGANICSNGNGVVKIKVAETLHTLNETTQTSDTPAYQAIPVTVPKLMNGNGEYTSTGAGEYYYINGFWHLGNSCSGGTATCAKKAVCTTCNQEYGSTVAHTEVTVAGKAATCTETGLTEGKKCSVCGTVTVAQTVIEKKDHLYETEVIAPTCGEQGYTTHTCTACGDTYTDNYTDALGHSWVDATCTDAKTCKTCGATEGEALGHTWNAATCTDPKTCSVCGETEGKSNGHNYESVVTDPDCTNGGYTTHTCTVCGDTKVDSYVDAAGHSYGDWYTTKNATCVGEGEERHDCANCDAYETRTVSATGKHTYANGVCSICGEKMGVQVELSAIEVSFDAEILLWTYFIIPDELLNDDGAYVVVVKNGAWAEERTVITMAELREAGPTSYGDYKIEQGIASGEMGRDVSIQFVDGNGNNIPIKDYADGSVSDQVSRNVVDYARRVLNGNNTKQKNLIVALLTYGGYAQVKFNVDADNPVYNVLTEYGYEIPTLSDINADAIEQELQKSMNSIGISYSAQEAYLDSAIYHRVYFKLDAGQSIENFKFEVLKIDVNGNLYREEIDSIGYDSYYDEYYVDILNIPAAYLDHLYTVTVTNLQSGEKYEVTTSVMAWAKLVMKNSKNPASNVNLAKALYYYNQAANTFFGK